MEQRILIYAPSGRDAALAAEVLGAVAIDCVACEQLADLAHQLTLGAAGVVTVEEALNCGGFSVLSDHVARQPRWSDLPIILLTHRGADSLSVRRAVSDLGNLTLLERPVRTLTLITSVQALLRARAKQYAVREAERRKDEFLASLGHELRNPLAPIKTSVALLAHLYPNAAPVDKIKNVIERQVTHLTRLVDDLLDVARITSGKIELQRHDISFDAVLGHVNELCLGPAAAKRIHIEHSVPAHAITLHVDYARVVQILANILLNAVKFTPFDGRIALRAWADGDTLKVSIKDSGIGLEPEAIERIFLMFEQSKTISGQISSGLGIGLSLARQFAEMHGGSITAYSEGSGLGSEFVISLPVIVRRARTLPADRPVQPCANGARRARVLVVDDNRDAADTLQVLFETEGFDVATSYDGQAALAAVQRQLPDLIVMDLGMPGMDGFEAARAIRREPDAEHILMIALTGWSQSDAQRRTAEAGFNHHMIKPVDFGAIAKLAHACRARAPTLS